MLLSFRDFKFAKINSDVDAPASTGHCQRNFAFGVNGGLGGLDSACMSLCGYVFPEDFIYVQDFDTELSEVVPE